MMDEQHIASAFDRDLEAIQAHVMKMGGLVEDAIRNGAKSLKNRDEEQAEQVRKADKAIDALEEQINQECALLLALRQPAASDLRTVLTVMKIAGNLERVGDYAKNMAKRTTVLVHMQPIDGAGGAIRRMAKEVQLMLSDALDAYMRRDLDMAHDVRQRDLEVDQMYKRAVPRVPDLHDGRPAQHHCLHASAFHRQEHRTHGRPCDGDCRSGDLPGVGRAAGRGPRPKATAANYDPAELAGVEETDD